MEFESNLNDYYSHLQILFIDEHDVENENSGGMRFIKVFLLTILMSLNLILK